MSHQGNPSHHNQSAVPGKQDLQAIVVSGDPKALVDWAKKIGQKLAGVKLTTNQIRNVFGAVRQIQMNWDQDPQGAYRQAILLQPKMAYFAKRERGMEHLEDALSPALDLVAEGQDLAEQHARFERFCEFFEARV